MTPARNRTGQAGFTMVEVMVSLVLAAIAMMGMMGLYSSSTKASSFSRHSTEAAVLAEDRIEKLRTITPAVSIPLTTEPSLDPQGNTVAGAIYTRTYLVVLATNYANVTVNVTWADDGITHTVTVLSRRMLP